MDEQRVIKARFAQVNIVIADMEHSMGFYRLLGVELADMPEPWGDHHRTVTNVKPDVTFELTARIRLRTGRRVGSPAGSVP